MYIRSLQCHVGKISLFLNRQFIHFPSSASKLYSTKEMNKEKRNNIVWVDLEMTGLDINKDHILEIACIVTDLNLNIIAEAPDIIIHQDDEILESMNQWCIEQHGQTGLTEASRNSPIDLPTAEKTILNFIKKYTIEKANPLAGNSIYMDRLFLKKHMPKIDQHLNYRIIDVSTIKELCRRWYPKVYKDVPEKQLTHRSLSDIKESIDELKYYKCNIFKE